MHETRGEKVFDYCYDANGQLYAVSYKANSSTDAVTYYYAHNWRGDITSIYDGDGNMVAKYEYDAWGNVLTVTNSNNSEITDPNHIANLNPFRYRSYYYDSESGLYYLMSRYYDPVVHRFLNADGYFQSGDNILDTNMNAYCGNNPIINFDPSGNCYVDKKTSAGTYIGTYWIVKVAVPGVPGYCNVCKSYNPNNILNSVKYNHNEYYSYSHSGVTASIYSYQQGTSYSSPPKHYDETVYSLSGDSEFVTHHALAIAEFSFSLDANNTLTEMISHEYGDFTYSFGVHFDSDSSGLTWEVSKSVGNYSSTAVGIYFDATYDTQQKAFLVATAVIVTAFVCPEIAPFILGGFSYAFS